MTEAPKRIWASLSESLWFESLEEAEGCGCPTADCIAYVRGDIANEMLVTLKCAESHLALDLAAVPDGHPDHYTEIEMMLALCRDTIAKAEGDVK